MGLDKTRCKIVVVILVIYRFCFLPLFFNQMEECRLYRTDGIDNSDEDRGEDSDDDDNDSEESCGDDNDGDDENYGDDSNRDKCNGYDGYDGNE